MSKTAKFRAIRAQERKAQASLTRRGPLRVRTSGASSIEAEHAKFYAMLGELSHAEQIEYRLWTQQGN